MNPPSCYSDKSASLGRCQYEEVYNTRINTSIVHIQCLKCIIVDIFLIKIH